jgi:hypothetical protein
MSGLWLLLRSHSARAYLAATAAVTLLGCALGPESRVVITRDGALGEPLPFVVALSGVTAMVCLVGPAPELVTTMPRSSLQIRAVPACFVVVGGCAAVAVSGLVAPGLVAATARNVFLALAVTFLVALWRPLLAWVPTSAYLALSWFYGTATYDDAARAWAIPAQPPGWRAAGISAAVAIAAGAAWVLKPKVARRPGARLGTGHAPGTRGSVSSRSGRGTAA